MILLRVERVERPVPLFVEETHAVAVEHVHHVRVVPTRRWDGRRRAYLGSAEELHCLFRRWFGFEDRRSKVRRDQKQCWERNSSVSFTYWAFLNGSCINVFFKRWAFFFFIDFQIFTENETNLVQHIFHF